MAVIARNHVVSNDLPRSLCLECDASFYIAWDRSLLIEDIEFCPFCGEEIDEIEDVTEED